MAPSVEHQRVRRLKRAEYLALAETGRWRTLTTHRRGETIRPLAFPDVAIAVADIVPPETA